MSKSDQGNSVHLDPKQKDIEMPNVGDPNQSIDVNQSLSTQQFLKTDADDKNFGI